ncbi:MAG: hypothetical protein M1827_005368 [Pycnora praestabilis]|nr:MAG: hypothetical protein M1827_005368 [Pycnora praestabilis]
MFRFPWSSDPGGEKAAVDRIAGVLAPKPRLTHVVDIPMLNKLKRKRAENDDSIEARIQRTPASKREANIDGCIAQRESDGVEEIVIEESSRKEPDGEDIVTEESLGKEKGTDKTYLENRKTSEGAKSSSQAHVFQARTKTSGMSEIWVGTSPLLSPSRTTTDRQTAGTDTSAFTQLQQTIEAQFSLEILLKHNELRLIDQELAKCQIALEQLRRCQEIPYPATSNLGTNQENVSAGTGPAVKLQNEETQPNSPAPWGVADGPYTRHYAKWLIPDPKFDGGKSTDESVHDSAIGGKGIAAGRTTRGSFTEYNTATNVSRSQRGSVGSKLHALSSGYPPSREKAGPLIAKRASDGQFVKLVCLDCEREDFSSRQGFLNHCRIAHRRNLESHEAAAEACGQVVETNVAGGLVGSVDNGTTNGAALGFVHPLIKSASTAKTASTSPRKSKSQLSLDELKVVSSASSNGLKSRKDTSALHASSTPANKPQLKPRTTNAEASPLVPSPKIPHLSALMHRKGFGGDLVDMVDQAKTKLQLDIYSSAEEGEAEDEDRFGQKPQEFRDRGQQRFPRRALGGYDGLCDETDSSALLNGARMPVRAGMSPAPLDRPSSRKGLDKPTRKPGVIGGISPRASYATPVSLASTISVFQPRKHNNQDISLVNGSPELHFSPNTVDSHNAPSLVSDDDEYEAHSDFEHLSSAEAEDEDRFLAIEVEDDDGGSETTATDPELASDAKAMPPRRTSAVRGRVATGNTGERRVTFVSPSKSDQTSSKKGGVRKGGN